MSAATAASVSRCQSRRRERGHEREHDEEESQAEAVLRTLEPQPVLRDHEPRDERDESRTPVRHEPPPRAQVPTATA